MLRRAGIASLWVGFLWGALISVQQRGDVDWALYTVAAVITLAGVIILRVARRQGLTEDGRVATQVVKLRESLALVDEKVGMLLEAREDTYVYDVHQHIDDELMPPIAVFVDARESMIEAFGIDTYAKVMTDFALAERLLNRAWCASADGYIDEVWASITRASDALGRAKSALPAE